MAGSELGAYDCSSWEASALAGKVRTCGRDRERVGKGQSRADVPSAAWTPVEDKREQKKEGNRLRLHGRRSRHWRQPQHWQQKQ